ncbi:MAG: hypothetical protein QM451_02320 [Bacillota bacterium]|jgi:hypothetical protein|nr:hypothetical protein [Bacillota bacterium]HHT91738.1 copper resistance protein NlpE [Bacillota bacterium]
MGERKALLSVILLTILVFFAGVVQAADLLGVYAGGHETAGMGGSIVYTYSVELKADDSYELKSYFVMGDVLYEFIETGTYSVDGAQLVITPEGQEPIEGSVNSDGTITIGVKPSQMARERTEAALTPSAIAVAGVYKATLQGAAAVEITLYLTPLGEYYYLAVPDSDSPAVHENGAYQVNGAELAFQVAESGETFAGKVEDDKVSAPFIVSAMMGMRMEIELAK